MAILTQKQPAKLIASDFKHGDRIQYKHPKASGWVEAIFHEFYTPDLAPKGAKWSFIELSVKGKLFKAFYLDQIRPSA
jgi:hypothetical protein